MIKDFLISFKDNFKEKTRNPFLGTYLIVWFVRNWELVYTLFNFDREHNLNFKIEFIKSYYKEHDFILNLGSNILWAFGLLIVTFILLNISRFIVNISEKQITPWIYKISDSKSIVLKETYDKLNSEKLNIEVKLEKERENRARLQNEISELENKLEDFYLSKGDTDKNSLEESRKEFTDESLDNTVSSIDLLLDKVKKRKYTNDFLNTESYLKRHEGWIEDVEAEKHVDYLTKIGLLSIMEARNGHTRYSVTKDGIEVLKRIRLELE
jgi:hypothetical protein